MEETINADYQNMLDEAMREVLLSEGAELLLPIAELKKELKRRGIIAKRNDDLVSALRTTLLEPEGLLTHHHGVYFWSRQDKNVILSVSFTPREG